MQLTKRQIEVLKLRSEGRSQREVARILGTSRENIAILESRALKNAERALKTLQQYLRAVSAFSETLKAGERVEEASRRVLERGNEHRARLKTPLPELEEVFRALGGDSGRIEKPLEVFVLRDGSIVVIPADIKALRAARAKPGGPAGT